MYGPKNDKLFTHTNLHVVIRSYVDSPTLSTMMVLGGSNLDENWNKILKIFIFRRIFGKS